jgi:hypothetical protein
MPGRPPINPQRALGSNLSSPPNTLEQQSGKTTAGSTFDLNPNLGSSLLGRSATTAVRARINNIEAIVSPPPPHGTNMATLQSGLPPAAIHDLSASESDSSEASEASQVLANISTGSVKVDDVKINLDEESMSKGETNDLLQDEDDDEMVVETS